MRHPRILNRAAQAVEAQGFEEGTTPLRRATDPAPAAGPLDEEPVEAVLDVAVHVEEFGRRIARAKVLSPPAEHRIEIRNDDAEIRMAPPARSQLSHTGAHPRHRAL